MTGGLKNIFRVLCIAFVAIFVSCGPNAQEKAAIENEVIQRMKSQQDSIAAAKSAADIGQSAQKRHDDSIASSIARSYQNRENSEKRRARINSLQQILIQYDGQLAVLRDRKKHDAEFHFGRLDQERENTLRNDQINIDNLKMRMLSINNEIQKLSAEENQ